MEPVPRLSCERCKRRKVRCDKRNPCLACEKAGTACDSVQRARLPRGRSGRVNKNKLEERVERLECLLRQVQDPTKQWPSYADSSNTVQLPPSSSRTSSFLAPEFWATLTEEVTGLRETLDYSDDEQTLPEPSVPINGSLFSNGHQLLFGSEQRCIPMASSTLSKEKRNILLLFYSQRVDCLWKLLHWPTMLADIERSHCEEQDMHKSNYIKVLEMSIYFMSLCSITDEEARDMCLGDRASLIEQYRDATEKIISEAGLLQNPDITVLQAFVIYLLGYRTFYNSATTWTLLAVTVRVGTALRLGQETGSRVSPFELELRRRLWYGIALMDIHASFDRGTLPMLRFDDLGSAPLLLNDDEMSPASVPTSSSPGFTDMSCFSLMFRSMMCHKKMLSIPDSTGDGWTRRLQLVLEFERAAKADYFNVREDAETIEKFAEQMAKGIIAGIHLVLRRPPYKSNTGAVPLSDDFNVLEHSLNILQHEFAIKSPEFAPWAWKFWVQWHALAIVLAELCSQHPGEDNEAAYAITIRSFNQYSSRIADSETGLFWKPIAKLMRRLQQLRSSNRGPELPPTSHSAFVLNVNGLTTLDSWMADGPSNLNTDSKNNFIPQGDPQPGMYNDAQINWTMFTDDINMDYSIEFENSMF